VRCAVRAQRAPLPLAAAAAWVRRVWCAVRVQSAPLLPLAAAAAAAAARHSPQVRLAFLLESFHCFRVRVFLVARPRRIRRCLGSIFLSISWLSYTSPKPVLRPPPKAVEKPNTTVFFSSAFMSLATSLVTSALGCEDLLGWFTSTTWGGGEGGGRGEGGA